MISFERFHGEIKGSFYSILSQSSSQNIRSKVDVRLRKNHQLLLETIKCFVVIFYFSILILEFNMKLLDDTLISSDDSYEFSSLFFEETFLSDLFSDSEVKRFQ